MLVAVEACEEITMPWCSRSAEAASLNLRREGRRQDQQTSTKEVNDKLRLMQQTFDGCLKSREPIVHVENDILTIRELY